jgi:hypothetical protein
LKHLSNRNDKNQNINLVFRIERWVSRGDWKPQKLLVKNRNSEFVFFGKSKEGPSPVVGF